MRDNGLRVTDLCRGGMFPAPDAAGRQRQSTTTAAPSTRRWRSAPTALVLVVGGLPEGSRDIVGARAMVRDGLAGSCRMRAPQHAARDRALHPMYAADRACVNTLEQALDLCDALGDGVGVAIDTYHVWWDPELSRRSRAPARAGILAHHICDWLVPPRDMLLDRGMMGDGVIDFRHPPRHRGAGFTGPQAVEILSETWWKRPGEEVLKPARALPKPCTSAH